MIEDGTSQEITRAQIVTIETAKLNGAPRVCIFAAYNDAYAPLADLVAENWATYARKHNYALRFYPKGFHLDPEHPKSYGDKNRFHWFYDLRGHADIVVYLDIDSIFVDMEQKIEPKLGDERFLWTYSDGGPMSGLMIARTDERTEKHLRYAYEFASSQNNVRHGIIEPNGISDQDAMTRLMHRPPFSSTFENCVAAGSIGLHFPDKMPSNPWIVTCRGGDIQDKWLTMNTLMAKTKQSQGAEQFELQEARRGPEDHPIAAYNPKFSFDRNWVGPPELKPRVYRTQSEKDTWYAVGVENEYRLGALKDTDVVIDIGAHIGSFSHLAYRNGSRSVYAYEIDPWHLEAAQANLAGLEDGAGVEHSAVVRGDDKRAAQYHYSGAWNSFGVIGDEVPSRSLDEIINAVCEPGESVRFLKIDCEGGEYPILYTCTQMNRIQEIAGEFHCIDASAPEVRDLPYSLDMDGLGKFLTAHGFEVEVISHGSTGNFFAKRPNAVAFGVGSEHATLRAGDRYHFGKLS